MAMKKSTRMRTKRPTPTIAEWAAKLQEKLVGELRTERAIHTHPDAVGDGGEQLWSDTLRAHLPQRYAISKAFVIDSRGAQSDQIDIVIHDPFYTACLIDLKGGKYIPAESVYAVLEVKQGLSPGAVAYAGKKIASVRRLHRTSAPINQPHQNDAKTIRQPFSILGGVLTLDAGGTADPFGRRLTTALGKLNVDERIDLGCVASVGGFEISYDATGIGVRTSQASASLMYFLFRLIARLQSINSAMPIDYDAYAQMLEQS